MARTQLLLLPDYSLERCNQSSGPSASFKCAISPSIKPYYHWVLSSIFTFAKLGQLNSQEYGLWIQGEDLWDEAKKQTWAEAMTNAPSRMKWWGLFFTAACPWVCGGLAWIENLELGCVPLSQMCGRAWELFPALCFFPFLARLCIFLWMVYCLHFPLCIFFDFLSGGLFFLLSLAKIRAPEPWWEEAPFCTRFSSPWAPKAHQKAQWCGSQESFLRSSSSWLCLVWPQWW